MDDTRTRLVLVEDDRDNLEVFSILLEERYNVFAYRSPLEALNAIDAVMPDVLVLDIGMRPVDGVQCLKSIRSRPAYRDIPALALTGFARDVERQRFLDGGFQAVVVKPVLDHAKLMTLIDRLASSPGGADLDRPATTTQSMAGGYGETAGRRPDAR